MPMKTQIPLSFPVTESYRADDFMPAECNQEALKWIERFPDWPYPAVIIYGEKGCGKTHLLSLWQERAGLNHIAIDDVDQFFGNPEAEEELFHQFNLAKENLTYILLSMLIKVNEQPIKLPDLASRLRAAPQIEIRAPGDDVLQGILVKMFHDRQLRVEPGVVNYIVPRIERSFAAARDLIARIDENSLAEKRSVTVPLVREILNAPELFPHSLYQD